MSTLVKEVLGFPVRGSAFAHYSAKRLNTWKAGGTVRYYVRPFDWMEACQLQAHLSQKLPTLWLGLGSNVLLPDGLSDLCILSARDCFNQLEHLGQGSVYLGSGLTGSKVAKQLARLGFDASFFAGIPGTIGGAIYMNAGCFGHETWQYLRRVVLINPDFKSQTYACSDLKHEYRQTYLPPNHGIIGGYFTFNAHPQATDQIKILLKKRQSTQPIGTANCGSVFRNPPGHAAAQLIDACGLKGYCMGDACVSNKHANFIENRGQASAHQILSLMEHIQSVVWQRYQIRLTYEAQVITPQSSHTCAPD